MQAFRRLFNPPVPLDSIAAAVVTLLVLVVALALTLPLLVPLAGAPAVVLGLSLRAGLRDRGLGVDEIERLRQAELALAAAPTPQAAARELAGHAIALLGAPAAVVLIEGLGDTVRVAVGDLGDSAVYEAGSRMRLLADNGTPCGSIAVAARRDGRPYDPRDERVLDALAERVSSTVHRLSLFDAVRSEQRTLADILGSSSDGIVSVGSDLHVRSWNPAMARITGISGEAAIGVHCCAVFKPRAETGDPRHGAGCPGRTGRAIEDLVLQIETPDGGTRWLNCAFSPLPDGGYALVARDVTARKQIEDEKADFLATVSHELRTPLTPIKGFLQTLLRRDAEFSSGDRVHIYEVMLREEARLERLVHQLLQATSLDNTDRAAAARVVDWAAIVAEQVGRFIRQDPSREIVLESSEVPKVHADPHLGQEVLGNLLSNALKYSPDGSPVRVVVEGEGVSVVTTVVDAGGGIPVGDRERIFGRFTRLGDHLTRAQPGVGLGLYIARRSVEAMGGRIWVTAADDGGAAFSFTLPVARPAAAPPAALRPLVAPGS